MAKRFVGKGMYDRKFHLLEEHGGVPKRLCTWRPIQDTLIRGEIVTCENCLLRQFDDDWSKEE